MVKRNVPAVLVIGEILFDVFPDGNRIGGAPFNFAFHLNALGIKTIFVSRIGEDADGEEILHVLKNAGMDVADIQIDPIHPTGRVYIQLDDKGIPEFTIQKNASYDFIALDNHLQSILNTRISMIYHGTLIQRTSSGFNTLQNILNSTQTTTPCFYDINLRAGCYHEEAILKSLSHCDILKLNVDELQMLKTILNAPEKESDFIELLMQKYAIEWICLTKGSQGSILFTSQKTCHSPHIELIDVVDTVGAGDAYSSILAAGYLYQWKPEKILQRATDFAASICKIKGAVPYTRCSSF